MSVKSEARSRSGRRNRSKRRGTSQSPAHLAPGFGSTAIRLAAGVVSLGIDELKTRLANIPEAPPGGEPSRKGHPRNEVRPTAVNVATGLAIVSMTQAGRLVAVARDVGDMAGAEVGRFEELPIIAIATRPLRRGYERYRAAMLTLSELGRREELEGRRIVLHLIDDTTTSSVKDIAESAVKEVAHSPEIAALVRAQSAGLATGTILEVRANSEQADATVERRVRRWLHLLRTDDPDAPSPGVDKTSA